MNKHFVSVFSSCALSFVHYVLDEKLSGLVGAADQRAGGRVEEAQVIAPGLPLAELFRGDVLDDFEVSLGRLHVLAEGEAVYTHLPQVLHGLLDLFVGLTQSEHDGRLGHQVGSRGLWDRTGFISEQFCTKNKSAMQRNCE